MVWDIPAAAIAYCCQDFCQTSNKFFQTTNRRHGQSSPQEDLDMGSVKVPHTHTHTYDAALDQLMLSLSL